ncbi:unnamed protein product [Adineta steineri]|uniref:RING-CH-type domain-containing protein n=1 Tax=Adineta steineri TaxID=433720 RepID=A0A813ZL64_9BILA|nr:unnamed protein product [Adineta steineri]CAF3792555.1 unnamed protein product [Adineta steineri]
MTQPLVSTITLSKSCRICLDNDDQNDLIRPCLCSGGSAYVHRKCLNSWRSMNRNGRGFKSCEVCQFEFVIEPVIDDPSADKKRLIIYRLLVSRDITLIILLIQAFIFGLAFLMLGADKQDRKIQNLYPDSFTYFGTYYLSSLIIFFALVGFFGLIGYCCGLMKNDNHNNNNCNCTGVQCFCVGTSCNNCDSGSGGGGGSGGEGILVVILIIVVIFAIIGVFVGVILSIMIVKSIMERHAKRLWLRQEAKKYIVKDFEGQLDQLRQISSQRQITIPRNPTRFNTVGNNTNKIMPSAPLPSVSVIT